MKAIYGFLLAINLGPLFEFLKDDDSTYKNFIEIYVNISPTSSPSPSPTSNIFLIFIDLGIVGRKYVIIIKLSW